MLSVILVVVPLVPVDNVDDCGGGVLVDGAAGGLALESVEVAGCPRAIVGREIFINRVRCGSLE